MILFRVKALSENMSKSPLFAMEKVIGLMTSRANVVQIPVRRLSMTFCVEYRRAADARRRKVDSNQFASTRAYSLGVFPSTNEIKAGPNNL